MRIRSILTLALMAMVMVTLSPFCMAANVQYPNPATALEDGFWIDWYYNPSANQDVNSGDTISWLNYYIHSDGSTGAVNPRLNWDSSGSSSGSNTPAYELTYGNGVYLGAQTTVYDGSTTYTITDSVTYHKVAYPYNNVIAQSYNFQFH